MPETKLLPVHDLAADRESLETAAQILREGGLVAIPTETVYGLAANALDSDAVRRIYEAKGRPSDNPLIVHIAEVEDARALATEFPLAAQTLAEAFWPGPLTMILPKSGLVPDQTSGGLSTVAIRMPSHPVARELIRLCGLPLAAPSANLSGYPSPTTAQHCIRDLNGRVEGIIVGEDCGVGVESTVISLVGERPRILRPGAITPEMISQALGEEVELDPAVTQELKSGAVAASPGMKYKHYSPRADVILVEGSWDFFQRYVEENAGERSAAMVFDGEACRLELPALEYGPREDSAAQAREIFSALRRMDDMAEQEVFVRCPSREGVGLAVYNRLIRAAGFDLVRQKALVLGLTGQTGAGKSTLSRYFADMGFGVVDADQISRLVTQPGSEALLQIASCFGPGMLTPDGGLDRRKMGALVFSDPAELKALTDLLNPFILEETRRQIELASDGHDYVLLDAPTLLESGGEVFCSQVAVVTAPAPLRLERIMLRDGLDEYAARQRMEAQPPEQFYLERGDYHLVNDGGEAQLLAQARAVAEDFILKGTV